MRMLLLWSVLSGTCVFGGLHADGAESVAEAPPLRWTVRADGSGFIDGLWFDGNRDGRFSDDERVAAGADGCSRLMATLARPPEDGVAAPLNIDTSARRVLLEGKNEARPISISLGAGEELANVQERLDRAKVSVFGPNALRTGLSRKRRE